MAIVFGRSLAAVCGFVLFLTGVTSTSVFAIDYALIWEFDTPLGASLMQGDGPLDSLVYDPRTGELVYEVGVDRGQRWWPPDLVSASGAFRTDVELIPVPLAEMEPQFATDEIISGQVIPGSNGIHLQYDGLRFWPFSVSDPLILDRYGLQSVPSSHSFGPILPTGLSETFLLEDIFASSGGGREAPSLGLKYIKSRGLMAGDADVDYDFDQLDLIRVHTREKYLTGEPATWGDGDWNGAPGGSVENPPTGDGVFNQLDVGAALSTGVYLTGPYAAVQPNGQPGDGQTSLVYNVGTGELSVDAPAVVELTSINIDSAGAIFTGDAAQNLGGSFDNDADANIFKATFGGSFGSVSFGNVAQAGLSEEFVIGDLSVVGSLAGGGDLGSVDVVYVPEPTASVLLAIGLLVGLTRIRRLTTEGCLGRNPLGCSKRRSSARVGVHGRCVYRD